MLEDGTYLIIDGRGRYNGLKHNGATHIKAMLRPPPKDLSELLVFAIQANQHRENLKSYDFAMMIQKLSVDNSMSNKDIAKRLAVSEAYISQILSLFTLPPEIVKEWADGDYGESAQNKLRYMRKVKDVSIQFLLARTAKRVHLAALQRIIDAYLFAIDEGSGVDSRVIELILHGDLEPNSAERVKTLAKLKNSEQQFELAKILSKDTYTCIRKGETPPDIDTLNEWVSTAKRHSAGIVDDETDQEVETPSAKYTFKPLSASKVAETYATWTTKFKEARKDTDYEPAKLAELRGVLKGIKLAGGYSK
jgi:ParB/RepB/Spo0J family partition protein